MTYLKFFICLILFFYSRELQSQSTAPSDSLLQLIETSKSPEETANLYLQIAENKSSTEPNEALRYLRLGLQLNLGESIAGEIHDRMGRLFYGIGDLKEALASFKLASQLKERSGEMAEAASANNRVGVVLVRQNKLEEALNVLTESAKIFEEIGDEVNLATVHNNIAGIFASIDDIENAIHYNELALPIFRKHGISQNEIITLTNLAGQYLMLNDFDHALYFNHMAEQIATELNNQYALGIVHNNFGQIYFERKDIKRSIGHYEQSLEAKLQSENYPNLVPTYNNLGQAYLAINQPQRAIQYLSEGLAEASGKERWHITSNLAKAYSKAFLPDSATYYFDKTLKIRDSLQAADRDEIISRLNTEYETGRRELEIEQLTALQEQSRIRLIWILALFGTTIICGFLILKNSRKKQIIAQQNEQIEKQNVEQLLQEQEIIGLNAMFQGQEKERNRIAEELHDSIGSSLATLKLYIESLAEHQSSDTSNNLHQKASKLLEETYDEVRKIAHSKSSGVLIKDGLIPAIELVANRISEARQINIEVLNTGLHERLDNNMETSIFLCIQQLISNSVKHSEAQKITIQITRHTDSLNLLIEDNGKGFIPSKIKWGMGFTVIESRMKGFEGEMVIDSTPGNGTTVILDIPFD